MSQVDIANQVDEAYVVFLKSLITIVETTDCDKVLASTIESLENAALDYNEDVRAIAKKLDERLEIATKTEYEKLTGHEMRVASGRV